MERGYVSCLSSREIEHTGEEIADVFIYSIRLADIVGLDMAQCVQHSAFESKSPITCTLNSLMNDSWIDCNFESLEKQLQSSVEKYRSHRQVSLQLQGHVGKVCQLFASYHESDNVFGLKSWSEDDIIHLKASLGLVGRTLMILAMMSNLRVGEVIARKFEKNAIKYPVELSKGSSAKYTEYGTKLRAVEGDRKQSHVVIIAAAVFAIGSSIHGYLSK